MLSLSTSQLSLIANYYRPVLQRYAFYMVKNKLVAALIIQEVLDNYHQEPTITNPALFRKYLQQRSFECCQQWLRTKSKTLYLRKPKNPT